MPKDIIELLQERNLAGKLIYVPKLKSHTLISSYTPKVLEETEAIYEKRGVTFYWEASSRKTFSGMFGTKSVAPKFQLKLRTATRVSSTAYRAWRDWFGHKERITLGRLRTLAEESGCNYSGLYFSYLEIRGRMRKNQKVTADYYAGFHAVPADVIRRVIDLAQSSIKSCPWRSS